MDSLTRIIVLSLSCVAQVTVAVDQSPEPSADVVVQNRFLRVVFEGGHGQLRQFMDVGSGFDFVDKGQASGDLWELEVDAGGQRHTLTPKQAGSFQHRVNAGSNARVQMIWEGVPVAGHGECSVEVIVRLDEKEPTSRWGISVTKPAGVRLRQIRFPRILHLRSQSDERLAVPAWMGQQLEDPRNLLCGTATQGRRLAWTYPGRMSMQFLAYYQQNGNGFYTACDDAVARHKTFAVWGTAGNQVHFEVMHHPEGQAADTRLYELPYNVVVGSFHGDWTTAAERYREWAEQQAWVRTSRRRQGLVPDWIPQTGLWVWNRGRSPGVLPPAVALQKRLRLPVHVFWHWWHGCPYDIGFPEYLPPREGTEAFQKAVTRAHAEGVRMLVYMNQRAWGMSTRSWEERNAERFAVKGEDGKVRPEVYNIFTGKALASMCLATPFWRNTYADLAEKAHSELGVDGIYMDQACSFLPCYDPHHGHPPGGGNSWIDGFGALSEDIRRRCDGDRPIVLAGEGCGEAWLPYLDLMLTLQVSKERYSPPNDPWEVIPMFQAVYHRHVVTFGSYSSLVMPPYDELWPAEFAPKEPLALLDRKYSRQFYLEQARAFVWGHQPTLANFRPSLLEERDEEMEYVMRLARVRHEAAKYLVSGEFLRPPEIDVPYATSTFSRLSIYAGQNSRLVEYRKRHPLVLAGAWRAADGKVAIALTNIADKRLSLTMQRDRDDYGLARLPEPLTRIDETGRRPMRASVNDDGLLKLDLPARDACVIELK